MMTLNLQKIRKTPNHVIVVTSVVIFAIAAVIIHDVKKRNVGKVLSANYGISGWRITHLCLHATLGYVFPNKFPLFFSLGVAWECTEYALRCAMQDPYWGEGFDYAQDVLTNTVGFCVGICIYKAIESRHSTK